MDGLTPKQKAFADEYLKCGNATEAYKIAYGCKNDVTAGTNAHKNLKKPKISTYIAERQKQIEDSRIADIAEVMQFFTRVMRGEEKDAFGLDISASDRMTAGREILKRNIDKKKLEIELLKLESQIKDNQPEEEAEDNFLDALNGTAAEVWEKRDGEENTTTNV